MLSQHLCMEAARWKKTKKQKKKTGRKESTWKEMNWEQNKKLKNHEGQIIEGLKSLSPKVLHPTGNAEKDGSGFK